MLPIRNHQRIARRIVSEELLLSVCGVTGRGAAGGRRQGVVRGRIAIAATDAEPESLENCSTGFLPRLEENPSCKLLVVFKIGVAGITRVAQAVEDAGGVARATVEQVAMEFRADVAVGNEIGRQGPLVKGRVRVRL